MTPTIIPYPKFLTKPWRCMALQAVHCQAVHHLAIHRRHCCTYTNVALLSKRPSPSSRCQAIHRQAIAPSIAKPSIAEPFIAVAVKPSIAVASPRCHRVADQAVHCHCIAVKPSIAKPSCHPSPSRPLPIHPLPSPSPLRFHQRPIAVTTSTAIALLSSCPSLSPCAVHR
jgi:hypothetical protein